MLISPLFTIIARALALVELRPVFTCARPQFANKQPPRPAHYIASAAPLVEVSPWKAVRQPCCAIKRAQNTALSLLLVISPSCVLGRCSLPRKQIYKPNQLLCNGNGSKWCYKKPLVLPCKSGRWPPNSPTRCLPSPFFFCSLHMSFPFYGQLLMVRLKILEAFNILMVFRTTTVLF